MTHEVLTGICPCCLGRFVVEGNRPVLHGYKRPGNGAIHGECTAVSHLFPAYERSTKGCIYMRDNFLRSAEGHRLAAEELRSGKTKEIFCSYTERLAARQRVMRTITVTPESSLEDLKKVGHYSWESLVESRRYQLERDEQHDRRDAATFQSYIDAWKPGLEFISEARLDAEKQEIRDQKAVAARMKRVFKALKAAFFHLGAAINKHRKGWDHAEWEWEQNLKKWDAERAAVRYADVKRLAPYKEMYPR
jgi:hypothetical protein